MSYSDNGDQAPPVKEGEELDVIVNAVGEKGDGIARVKGFVVFIPNTEKGQNCKIRIKKVLKSVAFGEYIGEGKAEAPKQRPKKETIAMSKKELMASSKETKIDTSIEDTEDFGSDLDEE